MDLSDVKIYRMTHIENILKCLSGIFKIRNKIILDLQQSKKKKLPERVGQSPVV